MSDERERLLNDAIRRHDLTFGQAHCDRKYILSCREMPGLILQTKVLSAPNCLDEIVNAVSGIVTTWYRCRLHPTNVQATTDGLEPDLCHRYDEIKDAPCFLPMETFVPPGPISTE